VPQKCRGNNQTAEATSGRSLFRFANAVAECSVIRRRRAVKHVGGIRSIDAGMSSVKFGSMTRVIGSSKVLSRGYSTAYEAVPKTKVKTERLMGM
jgi:hypothetical protein